MEKAELRKLFLSLRLDISRRAYWSLMDRIMEQVKQFDWTAYRTVHIFLPISRHNEIDTFSVLDYLKSEHPDIRIVIPRTDFENTRIINVLYDPMYTILRRNRYGIPEPVHGEIIPPGQIDLVFVPLLACDLKGNRAGYGKGFYDRFLARCKPDVRKIGLSFFEPVEVIDDVNESDIRLDACITPYRTWNFTV